MACCVVSKTTVLLLGVLFWMTGASVCALIGFQKLTSIAARAIDIPQPESRANMYRLVAAGSGVLFMFFQVPFVFYPLAKREVARIKALHDPRPWHFFHKWRLLALCIFIPSLSVVGKLTEKYFVSCMIEGGSVIPVSVGLFTGMGHLLYVRFYVGGEEWDHTPSEDQGFPYTRYEDTDGDILIKTPV